MKPMTQGAAAAVAICILAGCDDPTRPLAPSASRTSLDAGSAGGGTIAYVQLVWQCGRDMMAGCDADGPPGWNWTGTTHLATIGTDGANYVKIYQGEYAIGLEPAWSPDGMRIAFTSNGEIMVVAGAGGTPLNLTRHPALDASPAWSPDGGRIAFSSDRGGSRELYVMSAGDGASVTRLTSSVGFVGRPAWSPDGARIAFDCQVEVGNIDLCAVQGDGTGFVRLTSAPGYDAGADWSAAGGVAFATDRYGAVAEIAIMSGDGTRITRVAPGIPGTGPSWSPDGSRLAFESDPGIYLMGADGANPVLLAPDASAPSWRPSDAALPPVASPVAKVGTPTCLELTCTFDGTSSTDDVGTGSVYHIWSFGDGSIEYYSATPKHAYAKVGTYSVTLTVTASATGTTSTATQSVTVTGLPVGAPPVASFTTKCAGLTCTLDGTSSTDDAAVVRYSWNLGKETGEIASGAVVTTAYAAEGSRTVVLTVTDGAGQTGSTTRTFYAAPIPGDAPPVARLNVSCEGLQCTLDGRGSTDDNYIRRHYIDTGIPGSTPIWTSDLMTAYAPGTYTATLTVFDDAGQMNRVSKTFTVGAAPPPDQPPVARFTYSCVRTKCTFDGRASTDDQGIVSYSWNLGNLAGASVTGAVVTHDYRRPGTYNATLVVRDAAGQFGSATQAVTAAK